MERFTPYDKLLESAVQQLIRSSYKYKKHTYKHKGNTRKKHLKTLKILTLHLDF
jgi:hypothetical protein